MMRHSLYKNFKKMKVKIVLIEKKKRDDFSPNRQQKVVWKKVTLTTISNILMTNLILVND